MSPGGESGQLFMDRGSEWAKHCCHCSANTWHPGTRWIVLAACHWYRTQRAAWVGAAIQTSPKDRALNHHFLQIRAAQGAHLSMVSLPDFITGAVVQNKAGCCQQITADGFGGLPRSA